MENDKTGATEDEDPDNIDPTSMQPPPRPLKGPGSRGGGQGGRGRGKGGRGKGAQKPRATAVKKSAQNKEQILPLILQHTSTPEELTDAQESASQLHEDFTQLQESQLM